jgi:ABC-2 type transport system ATP-binding protein
MIHATSADVAAAPIDTPSAISATRLSKRYRATVAVDSVSFQVPSGVVCGVIGPNGAGKTTLMRMLLGLVRPSSGQAEVLGAPLNQPAAYLSRVGALIEAPAFYPGLSGHDNLRLLARLGGIEQRRIAEVLGLVGLAERSREPVRAYSLGMKQRLGVAAALLPRPALLILDEPMNGLDPAGIVETRALLRSLADMGVTVIVSSHLLGEVEQVCDHLLLLLNGQIRFAGPTRSFAQQVRPRLRLRPEHTHDLARLSLVAADAGYLIVREADVLFAEASAPDAAALNRAAHAAGITLVELSQVQPGLEAVFFQLTQRREPSAVPTEHRS